MNYPDFFEQVEKITLIDPLAEFLGSFHNGEVTFSYIDIVKAAGHSCPTVAGAYLMCLHGLKQLYPEQLPVRGQIQVEFKEPLDEGVAGVIANVFTQITGATDRSGFKGINGQFIRHSLMAFERPIRGSARLTRMDTQKSIEINYDPHSIPGSPEQQQLFPLILQNQASAEQKKRFGELWQARVEKILCSPAIQSGIITVTSDF